jgi:hypothetical protein
MIIRVEHQQMMRTGTALSEHADGLITGIVKMKEALKPLYADWYRSGSPTGKVVETSEIEIDGAMTEITKQMGGIGQVIVDHSADLRKTDEGLAGR